MKSVLRNFMFPVALTLFFHFGGVDAHSTVQLILSDTVQVALPDTSGKHGETVAIPVIVSDVTGKKISSAQMFLTFDNSVLTADSAYTSGTIAQGWGSPTFNNTIPGQMRIAMAGSSYLTGTGVLVYVVFIVNGSQDDTTTIHFENMFFNEGDPAVITNDGIFKVSPGGDVADENEFLSLPTKFILFQNHPNPFNPITCISFTLPELSSWNLKIYNVVGQLVKSFERYSSGYIRVTWDGKDNDGNEVASGIYFYRLQAGDFTQTRKMVLAK